MYKSVHPTRARLAAVGLALFVVVPAVGHAKPPDATVVAARDVSKVGIDNFGRVAPNYYRGAEPDDEQYAKLAALGIKTVIDLRSDDVDTEDRVLVERAGMKYVQIPMTTHQPPTPEIIDQFLRLVDDPGQAPVYVHCVGGRHRTGVMTAIYRMARQGWTADQAFKEMKTYRYGADFLHPEFKKFVYAYRPAPDLLAKIAD